MSVTQLKLTLNDLLLGLKSRFNSLAITIMPTLLEAPNKTASNQSPGAADQKAEGQSLSIAMEGISDLVVPSLSKSLDLMDQRIAEQRIAREEFLAIGGPK